MIFNFFFNSKSRLDITMMVIGMTLPWVWTYSWISENLYRFLKLLFNVKRTRFQTMVTAESGLVRSGIVVRIRRFPVETPLCTRRSTGFRDSDSLRGSRWPSGWKCKAQWLTLDEWGCPLDNGLKLAVFPSK